MHAIRVSRTGGPEVLEYVEVDRPESKAGEALVRIEAAGVNFIDVYHRTGLARLAKRGTFLTRPSIAHYTATRYELLWRARELFAAIGSGAVKLRIDRELPLRDAAEAHRLLESRQTEGKLLLIP